MEKTREFPVRARGRRRSRSAGEESNPGRRTTRRRKEEGRAISVWLWLVR